MLQRDTRTQWQVFIILFGFSLLGECGCHRGHSNILLMYLFISCVFLIPLLLDRPRPLSPPLLEPGRAELECLCVHVSLGEVVWHLAHSDSAHNADDGVKGRRSAP